MSTRIALSSLALLFLLAGNGTAADIWQCQFTKFCVAPANRDDDKCEKLETFATVLDDEGDGLSLRIDDKPFAILDHFQVSEGVNSYLAKTNEKSFVVLTIYPNNAASVVMQTFLGAPWTSSRFGSCEKAN